MPLATVSNRILTSRVNTVLGTRYRESYISQVRQGKEGSAALKKVVREEVAAMLQEAAAEAANHHDGAISVNGQPTVK